MTRTTKTALTVVGCSQTFFVSEGDTVLLRGIGDAWSVKVREAGVINCGWPWVARLVVRLARAVEKIRRRFA